MYTDVILPNSICIKMMCIASGLIFCYGDKLNELASCAYVECLVVCWKTDKITCFRYIYMTFASDICVIFRSLKKKLVIPNIISQIC